MIGGRRPLRVGAVAGAVAVGICLSVGSARAAQPVGALTQLPGTAGCFTYNGNSEDGAGTCSKARGLAAGESAIVSPDGKNVYAGSYKNSGASLGPGFAVFSRNPSTSALTQLAGPAGCLTSDGSSSAGPGTCIKARGLDSAAGDGRDLAFTSDGRWAYMVAQNHDPGGKGAVLIFQRDPSTGALTQLPGSAGCISPDGSDQDGPAQCQTDATLNGPDGISISSGDRFIYVVDYDNNTIHVFSRNSTNGALNEVQCIGEAPAPAGCSTGRAVGDSQFLSLSSDGMHAYGGDFNHGLSIFDRNPSTGLLTQKAGTAGCITNNGKDNTGASTCAVGRDARGNYPVLIAPNGATLYNADSGGRGFSVFHVNGDGTLTQLSGTHGCVTINGKDNTGASTCAVGRAVDSPYGGAIAPDGSTLYVSQRLNLVGGVGVFSLDSTTGFVTQLAGLQGCITTDGSSGGTPGQCVDGTALSRSYGMSVSPDGTSVYQATVDPSNAGLAVYARTPQPAISSLRVSPSKFSLAGRKVNGRCAKLTKKNRRRRPCRRPVRLRISYTLNVAATVTFTLKRELAGRRVGGRCIKRTKKNSKHAKCTRLVGMPGRIVRTGTPGANRFTFKGTIGGHRLGSGAYQLVATPTGGAPMTATFKIAP